jgi:hypothetical protein
LFLGSRSYKVSYSVQKRRVEKILRSCSFGFGKRENVGEREGEGEGEGEKARERESWERFKQRGREPPAVERVADCVTSSQIEDSLNTNSALDLHICINMYQRMKRPLYSDIVLIRSCFRCPSPPSNPVYARKLLRKDISFLPLISNKSQP